MTANSHFVCPPVAPAEAKSQEPVAVKPLEWSDHEGDGVMVADAVTGEYRVRCHGGDLWVVARDGIPLSNRPYELARFAKAAAQADYEQRIRSALIHPTTKPEAPAVSVDAIIKVRSWLATECCSDPLEVIDDALIAAGITEVPCPECDGAGEWDEGPLPATSSAQISPDYRHE